MASAIQVASLYGVLNLRDNMTSSLQSAQQQAVGFGSRLQSLSGDVRNFGLSMTAAFAPVGAALAGAINTNRQFESNMLNVQAVMGATNAEMATMSSQIQQIARGSRFDEVLGSKVFFDIASGVQDTTQHLAIYTSAIDLATATQADLAVSANAIIGAMNSYGFAAEDAAFVSDVLTRSWSMGVGTGQEFGAYMGQAASLANTLGISYDQLGVATSFLTTQNRTVSQSTTQLMGIMNAFLKPNTAMSEALQGMGFESGEAAISALGLQGAVSQLMDTVGDTSGMATALGSTEALQGAIGLLNTGYSDFSTTYLAGLDGIAAGSATIQNQNAAYDLLRSKVVGLSNDVGSILNPAIQATITDYINPMIDRVSAWAMANPELTQQIVFLTGALVLAGPAVTAVGVAIGVLLSPVSLLAAGIAAIVYAAHRLYPGGIVALFNNASTAARQLGILGLAVLNRAAQSARTLIEGLIGTLVAAKDAAIDFLNHLTNIPQNQFELATSGPQGAAQVASNATQTVSNFVNPFAAVNNFAAGLGARLTGHAAGGSVTAGRDYIVGENGPELFKPSTSGMIVSNQNMMAASGGSGDFNINGNITVIANDPEDFMRQLQARRRRRR